MEADLDLIYQQKTTDSQRAEAENFVKKYHDVYIGHYLLGSVLSIQGEAKNAQKEFQTCISLNPQFIDAYLDLAISLYGQKNYPEMLRWVQKGLEEKPTPKLYNLLGIYYKSIENLSEANIAFSKALTLPEITPQETYLILANLSSVLFETPDYTKTLEAIQRAFSIEEKEKIEDKNSKSTLMVNLAMLKFSLKQYVEAEKYFRLALELPMSLALRYSCLNNYASILSSLGSPIEALKVYEAILSKQTFPLQTDTKDGQSMFEIFQNKIYAMNFLPIIPRQVYEEHLKINAVIPSVSQFPHIHSESMRGTRKIKVGFVSADFIQHPVSFFLLPIIRNYNKDKFEMYFYSNNKTEDEVSKLYRSLGVHWISIIGKPDADVANQIQSEGIDILIDLGGHTSGNRLGVFRYKPAPIQITYLGYPNTTGLKEMDFRIVDRITDNRFTQCCSSETLMFMLKCFLCYDLENLPNSIPRPKESPIVFGIMNKLNKCSPECLLIWKQIFQALPDSKVLYKPRYHLMAEDEELFMKVLGITKDRLILVPPADTHSNHMKVYDQIDICLDTFPYSGTTTTCEALSMNKPVITLYHSGIHAHNVSSSILSNMGCFDLIAKSEHEYVSKAIEVAESLQNYTDIRDKFVASMNPKQFTREFEELLINAMSMKNTC
jgi:Predicted O-linked N-acetylglucosamine transferase, SPINDLY family